MLLVVALVASLAALAGALDPSIRASEILSLAKERPDHGFMLWTAHYKKEYDCDEHKEKAQKAFHENVAFIYEQMERNPDVKLELNQFADMTWEEFSATRLGLKPELLTGAGSTSHIPGFMYADSDIPEAVDWVAEGVVSDVKNQGQCGSCWAFSTTGSIEGINAIKTGELVVLSEQELVDCDTEKDMGCNGGLMNYAFDFVVANGGLDTEKDYDYWSGWGISFMCNSRKRKDRTVVTIDGHQNVPETEEDLLKAVANQPISIGICASSTLMFYAGGVLSECCDQLNHGVLLVGYDKDENGQMYYKIKNSWSDAWGEQGYFRLKVKGGGQYGLCGIAKTASYPVKTSENHPVPEMCDMFGWSECPAKNTCSCSFSFFGLFCLWHDCCPLENGVTCSDLSHCCPEGTVCDEGNGVCVDESGEKPSVPWTDKEKATLTQKGEEASEDLPKKMLHN